MRVLRLLGLAQTPESMAGQACAVGEAGGQLGDRQFFIIFPDSGMTLVLDL